MYVYTHTHTHTHTHTKYISCIFTIAFQSLFSMHYLQSFEDFNKNTIFSYSVQNIFANN